MILRKSKKDEIDKLVGISKAAFSTDAAVGGKENDGPPGYDSIEWHKQMLMEGHLYTYLKEDGEIVGGAILFDGEDGLYIGRIFIHPRYFRCGYGMKLMENIENAFRNSKVVKLDTPVWNVRTYNFYRKCGYIETSRDEGSVYFEKYIEN